MMMPCWLLYSVTKKALTTMSGFYDDETQKIKQVKVKLVQVQQQEIASGLKERSKSYHQADKSFRMAGNLKMLWMDADSKQSGTNWKR